MDRITEFSTTIKPQVTTWSEQFWCQKWNSNLRFQEIIFERFLENKESTGNTYL